MTPDSEYDPDTVPNEITRVTEEVLARMRRAEAGAAAEPEPAQRPLITLDEDPVVLPQPASQASPQATEANRRTVLLQAAMTTLQTRYMLQSGAIPSEHVDDAAVLASDLYSLLLVMALEETGE
jgi:cell division protein FtsN